MLATTVANNGHATLSVVLPERVTVGIAGALVHAIASENADKTGWKYKAKARMYLPADDTRTDQEVLLAVAKKILFESEPIAPSSNFRDENGNTVVGLTSPKLDKSGKVTRPSEPCVNFWRIIDLGESENTIAYQVLVRTIAGRNANGRFVAVIIDATKRPQNEFKPVGEVEGTFDLS